MPEAGACVIANLKEKIDADSVPSARSTLTAIVSNTQKIVGSVDDAHFLDLSARAKTCSVFTGFASDCARLDG